jgi:hypothetical protein
MIDESLLKSNFLGRDGFRWWIGQIPPIGSQGGQASGSGWGNRYKVRIMGYHPYSEVDLPNEDLPYAQCLIPTTAGSGAANVATDVKLQPGDVVFGFFLDGDNGQLPVIMGTFGRTSQVPSKDYASPFQAFTGYTDKIKAPNGTLKKGESNEQNADSQKSPRHVSPKQAASIGKDEVSYFSGIGDVVQLATASSSPVNKIGSEVSNLIKTVQNLTTSASNSLSYVKGVINREIDRVTTKIQGLASGLVGGMVNDLFKKLTPILNKGLQLLYKQVYALVLAATQSSAAAHLAGVAAQTAMVPLVKTLENTIPCITNTIIGGLGSIVKNILKSLVDNVSNFVSCAANQFIGSMINDIIGKISSGLSSSIGGVQNILKFFGGFSVGDVLREGIGGIAGISDALNCGQTPSKSSGVSQWVIGSGPKNVPPVPFDQILKSANVASSLANSATDLISGFDIFNSGTRNPNTSSPLGGCYTGPPVSCNPPSINIFGGGGEGATAIPLLGSIVGSGRNATGSLIGVKVTNGGSGYEFPPFVEIVDNCNQGYGGVARSIIDDNGKLVGIYIVSEGENYPVAETKSYVVTEVDIIDPGSGYSDGDVVVDNSGNTYDVQIFNGSIIKVQPINTVDLNELPVLSVLTATGGSGAILRPNLDERSDFQGEIKQVIDCITK